MNRKNEVQFATSRKIWAFRAATGHKFIVQVRTLIAKSLDLVIRPWLKHYAFIGEE